MAAADERRAQGFCRRLKRGCRGSQCAGLREGIPGRFAGDLGAGVARSRKGRRKKGADRWARGVGGSGTSTRGRAERRTGEAAEALTSGPGAGRWARRSGGRRAGEAGGALGRLRDGCGDRSELGRRRRAGHAELGRVREEGVDWALREKRKGERAGLRGKKQAKQRGRTGPGFWGKGWKAGYCYGFPFLF